MRNYLAAIIIVVILPVLCIAAQRQWWDAPNSTTVPDNSKVQIYDPAVGSRVVTGDTLKGSVVDSINNPRDGALQKQPATATNPYQRLFEARDSSGIIKWYVTAKGKQVIGTPKDLSISSVYPANGTTNVSNGTWFNYSTTGGGRWRINPTVPRVVYNKTVPFSISTTYIVGTGIEPVELQTLTEYGVNFYNFSGAAGTTYTMRVHRSNIVQEDGQTGSSCGTAMTDVAGICESTFTMR